MKPTSIISLVIAVLLVIVGLVTCIIAQNMANANGEYLFAESRDGDMVETVDLSGTEISKIELIADNVQVNIFGRQEKSYIEFINFRENYYSISSANRVLGFDEIPDIKSMLKFWENGFSFKGMRYILNFNDKTDETREKVINVYLSSDKEIKIFDIKADNLELNVTSMTTATDYNITTKNAIISGDVLRTSSAFNINSGDDDVPAEQVKLNLDTALLQYINVNARELFFTADKFRCSGEADIVSESGDISLASITKPTELKLDITTNTGSISIGGSEVMSPYSQHGSESSGLIKITTDSSNITIISSSENSSSDQNG